MKYRIEFSSLESKLIGIVIFFQIVLMFFIGNLIFTERPIDFNFDRNIIKEICHE